MDSTDADDDAWHAVAAEAEATQAQAQADAMEAQAEADAKGGRSIEDIPEGTPQAKGCETTTVIAKVALHDEDQPLPVDGETVQPNELSIELTSTASSAAIADGGRDDDTNKADGELCEDGSRRWKPSSSRSLLPPVECPEQTLDPSIWQHWDGYTIDDVKVLAGYSRTDGSATIASFITRGKSERLILWKHASEELVIERLFPEENGSAYEGYSPDKIAEQKPLTLKAATAWAYFMAKGRALMDGAISSASDSVVLMTKRIIEQPPVVSSHPTGSSEPLSSAASKLNAGHGVESLVLKTPGQVVADLEAESTGQQYSRPKRTGTAASSTAAAAAASSAASSAAASSAASSAESSGASSVPSAAAVAGKFVVGDTVSIVAPETEKEANAGICFEVVSNSKGWIRLVNAVSHEQMESKYRPKQLALVVGGEGGGVGGDDQDDVALFGPRRSRKRAAELARHARALDELNRELDEAASGVKELQDARKERAKVLRGTATATAALAEQKRQQEEQFEKMKDAYLKHTETQHQQLAELERQRLDLEKQKRELDRQMQLQEDARRAKEKSEKDKSDKGSAAASVVATQPGGAAASVVVTQSQPQQQPHMQMQQPQMQMQQQQQPQPQPQMPMQMQPQMQPQMQMQMQQQQPQMHMHMQPQMQAQVQPQMFPQMQLQPQVFPQAQMQPQMQMQMQPQLQVQHAQLQNQRFAMLASTLAMASQAPPFF